MKSARQNVILEIIASNDIETQNQLMQALSARGVSSTQATLSRDIKELRLVKELSPSGRYRYAPASHDETGEHSERLRKIFKESVVSCDTAMNIIVIKTLPGWPWRPAPPFDGMDIPALVGSVAGDDTAFLAMRDVRSCGVFLRGDKEAVLNYSMRGRFWGRPDADRAPY